MRLSAAVIGACSVAATAATVANAIILNKQFYPAIVYLSKSNASMAVIYFQSLIVVYMIFQLFRTIFFGDLRVAEAEHLTERIWHTILESCLAFTVFRDDFSPIFVIQFVLLLFVKCFHWLADDRVDMMERSPVITLKFHLRMMGIVALLGAIDSYLVSYAYFTTIIKGPSSQIVFGFEYAILLTLVVHVTIKYVLHIHDLRTAQSWENKAVYLLYAELVINFLRCILYGCFVLVMLKVHSFPLFSIRPFYISLRSLIKAFNDVVQSRRAIHAMNNLFPIVSNEELATMDATCIICREEMTAESQPKKLPCSHVFHAHCLRSWFQRQQTCPTCRTDILGAGMPNDAARAAAAQGAPVPGQIPNLPPNFMPFLAHQFGINAPNNQMNQNNPPGAPNVNQARPAGPNPAQPPTGHAHHAPPFPPFVPPPFHMPGGMFMPPFPPPPPLPPLSFPTRPNFVGLSEDELRAMEGDTREAVENRIRALQDIYTLLEAAGIQMQQYLNTTGRQNGSGESTTAQPRTPEADSVRTDVDVSPATTNDSATSSTAPVTENEAGTSETHQTTSSPNTTQSPSSETDELRQRRLRRFGDSP